MQDNGVDVMKTIDTSNDWNLVEDRETVLYFSKTSEKPPTPGVVVPNAKRMALDKEEIETDADLASYGIAWHVWRNQLSGIIPKFGDVLQDQDGFRFVVKRVGSLSFRQRFRLVCLMNPKIVNQGVS